MGKEEGKWVGALLGETYFGACDVHAVARKNERNVFCVQCRAAICQHCLPSHHSHSLLQIRRYVYHDVIRLHDIEKLVDCEHVQAYIVNSAKVVFLNQRPQSRPAKGFGNTCETCDRILQEGCRYCSLACKVDSALKKGGKGGKGIKAIVTSPLPSLDKELEQLSPNSVFLELTSSSLSPSSSVSTANDASLAVLRPTLSNAHASSKPTVLANTQSIQSSNIAHLTPNHSSNKSSKLVASSSSRLSKSLNFASSPTNLKWARTVKWPSTSKFEKKLLATPFGKFSITSKLPNGHTFHVNKPGLLLEQSRRQNHIPSIDGKKVAASAHVQDSESFPLPKRRKGTPHRSPIC